MADNRGPDWTVFGAAVAGVITAIGGVVTIMRRNPATTLPPGADRTAQTLDGVFKLLEQVQEERDRLYAHTTACLAEIAECRSKIAALESQVRMLSWPTPGGNPPAGLT